METKIKIYQPIVHYYNCPIWDKELKRIQIRSMFKYREYVCWELEITNTNNLLITRNEKEQKLIKVKYNSEWFARVLKTQFQTNDLKTFVKMFGDNSTSFFQYRFKVLNEIWNKTKSMKLP